VDYNKNTSITSMFAATGILSWTTQAEHRNSCQKGWTIPTAWCIH